MLPRSTGFCLQACVFAALGAGVLGAEQAKTGGLRELSTDRPDATESPFTVDPGRVQLEMDVTTFTRNRLDGVRTTEWQIAPFNVRYGITPRLEAGVFVTPHVQVTEQPRGGTKTTTRGFGDTVLRGKVNFWGNDGGAHAFGLIVDLKLPTADSGLGNEKVEGAITLPFSFELSGGWEGAAMTSVEIIHTGTARLPVWVNTMTCAHDITGALGGFLELTSAAGEGTHAATFNCGLTYKLSPTAQLDVGCYIGLSRAAPDLTVFAGVSRKF